MTDNKLPDNWKKVQLGNYVKKNKLVNPTQKPEEPFVYIDVSSVSNETYKIITKKTILGKNAPSRARKQIQTNDILFATVRPTLKRIAIIPPELNGAIASTGYCVVRTIENKLNPFFVYYYLLTNSVSKQVENLQKGATYPAINDSVLFNQLIPLPPPPEQRAISQVLQTLQKTADIRRQEMALEKERKAALMQHLFTHGTRGEARKITEIGEVPESWQVIKLGDYSQKPEYGFTTSAIDTPTQTKFLRISDIQNEDVNWDKVPYCECDTKSQVKYALKAGDIVIARIGATTGKAFLIRNCQTAVFASYLIRIRTKYKLLPQFLSFFFQTENYWLQINKNKGGKLKGGVNIPIMQNLIMPLPLLDEQDEILEVLQACDKKIAALKKEIALLDELFKAMLEELMTGRLSALGLND